MSSKFQVIVLELKDDGGPPRMVTPPEALFHARAQYYQTRYSAFMFLVVLQFIMTITLHLLGMSAVAILIGDLTTALMVGIMSGLAAWITRKGLLE